MDILSIAIIVFLVMESLNILMLYFMPGSQMGNGVGVFNAFERSKSDDEMHTLVKYLINWVAGTKLIFVALLIVILIWGSESTRLFAVIALIVSILTYFWRLHPAIKKLDKAGHITPKGYSRTLGFMIIGFLVIFGAALGIYFII